MTPAITTVVKEVVAGLELLAAADLHELLDDEAADALVALMGASTALDATIARFAGHVDGTGVWRADGSRSAAAWLSRHTRRHRPDCNTAVRRGRHLADLPLVAAAFAEGRISAWHVDAITKLRTRWPEAVAAAEADLVDWAETLECEDFTQVTRYWAQHVDPDGVEDDAVHRYRRRRLNLSDGIDGCGLLDVEFEPVGWATFREALRRIEHELWEADWAEARERLGDRARPADLARTDTQRRYDALIELARRGTANTGNGKARPLFTVHVDHDTLAGRICQLSTGTVLTPGEVLPLLADCNVERAVFGPGNRVIELGHTQRLFVGGTRRAVEITQPTCAHGGCRVPAEECDIDHVLPWESGGATDPDNGQPLCPPHHRHKSERERGGDRSARRRRGGGRSSERHRGSDPDEPPEDPRDVPSHEQPDETSGVPPHEQPDDESHDSSGGP